MPRLETKDVIEALRQVNDPELHIDVYTLGLIYGIRVDEQNNIFVLMTYTTPACPYGPMIAEMVHDRICALEGAGSVEVEITFEPLWKPSDEIRALLGI